MGGWVEGGSWFFWIIESKKNSQYYGYSLIEYMSNVIFKLHIDIPINLVALYKYWLLENRMIQTSFYKFSAERQHTSLKYPSTSSYRNKWKKKQKQKKEQKESKNLWSDIDIHLSINSVIRRKNKNINYLLEKFIIISFFLELCWKRMRIILDVDLPARVNELSIMFVNIMQ